METTKTLRVPQLLMGETRSYRTASPFDFDLFPLPCNNPLFNGFVATFLAHRG
jgi:hypothetical protein